MDAETNRQLASFKPELHHAIQQIRERRANLAVRKARTVALNRDAEPNALLRSDLRSFYLSKDLPKRIELALNSDYAMAAAIFEGGQMVSGLEDQIWEKFELHWMALNHMRVAGLEASYAIKSTPEYITGAGVDTAAAYSAAVESVKAFNHETELLKLAEAYFQSLGSALMLLTNKPAEEILGLV